MSQFFTLDSFIPSLSETNFKTACMSACGLPKAKMFTDPVFTLWERKKSMEKELIKAEAAHKITEMAYRKSGVQVKKCKEGLSALNNVFLQYEHHVDGEKPLTEAAAVDEDLLQLMHLKQKNPEEFKKVVKFMNERCGSKKKNDSETENDSANENFEDILSDPLLSPPVPPSPGSVSQKRGKRKRNPEGKPPKTLVKKVKEPVPATRSSSRTKGYRKSYAYPSDDEDSSCKASDE